MDARFFSNNALSGYLSSLTPRNARNRTIANIEMHAVTNAVSLKLTGVTARVSAKVARRAQKVALRASVDDEAVTFTSDDLSKGLKAADAAWEEKAAEPAAAPAAFSAAIDPADGSVAEAAPLGDDMSMLNDAMIAFKEPRAVEIINGRVAMIGWMVALYTEIEKNTSLFHQVINTRTFTLADGVVKSSTFPAPGMFLIPVTVLFVLAASLAPVLRGNEESGLEKAPKDFGPFKAESEMTNGRGAMVGLVALLLAEKFTNGAALF